MAVSNIEIKIRRWSPEVDRKPHYQTYQVPYQEMMSVANALQYINEHFDGGLAYGLSCRNGLCMGCVMRVNGKAVLACKEIVKGDLIIEPLDEKRVIKDLIMVKR